MITRENDLTKLMKNQIKTLDKFCIKEKKLRTYIYEKKWHELENIIKEMAPISEKLEQLEKKRNIAFNELKKSMGEDDDAGFYQVIVKLPEKERDICSELYRNLKLAVMKIRGVTKGIDAHVKAANSVLNQLLEEIYPHRRGNIYSKNGGKIPLNMEGPMIVNREL